MVRHRRTIARVIIMSEAWTLIGIAVPDFHLEQKLKKQARRAARQLARFAGDGDHERQDETTRYDIVSLIPDSASATAAEICPHAQPRPERIQDLDLATIDSVVAKGPFIFCQMSSP